MPAADLQSPEFLRAEAAALWCVRLAEGEMTSAARAEFARWLASDPGHRSAFDQAVAAWEETDAAEATPEILALRVGALESLRRAQRARRRWPFVGAAARRLLAASVVVAVLYGSAIWWFSSPQEFSSGIGERRTLALTDGSVLSLDASSAVRVRYSGAQRALELLQGRAKFDVAKDPRRPFSVRAADREIVATGTAFSVEIVQRQVRVILYTGHVSVAGPGAAPTPLSAGQELIAPISQGQVRTQPIDTARSLSWQNGQLEFVDEPLAAALERVNRYARRPLSAGDAAAANVRISGVFTAGDARAFIEGVTTVTPLRVEERNGQQVLLSSRQARQ